MVKYNSIKKVCVAVTVFFLITAGNLLSASAESLSGSTNDGSATTSSPTFSTVTSVTVSTPAANDPILVVVTFMTESQGTLTIQKNPEFNLTDTEGTAQNTIVRSLQGVSGGDNDRGIGSIVNIFSANSTTPTYYFQHRSTTGGQTQTKATIVAIPLHSSPNNKILASASARAADPTAEAAPATLTGVTGTNISVGTTALGYGSSPGAYYVAASVETYSSSISGTGNIGQWQLQYSSDGSTWHNLGYPIQRNVRTANQYGVANLVGLLPNITPGGTDYQFRLAHQQFSGSTPIYTADVNIVSVFTGIDVSGPLQFPTYEIQSPLVTTTSTTPVEAIGLDYTPQAASTDLFMHAQYWMSSTGKDYAYYDLDVSGASYTTQQLDRYLPAGSKGSGASLGLANGLSSATTYRVSLEHSHDATGQTLSTQSPWLVMMDLNTPPPSPDLAVSKVCADLIPGQNDALIYTITISNIGTDTSPVSTLNDPIPTGVGGSLSDIRYVIDAGIPPAEGNSWPATDTVPLPSIPPGDYITVRIYADVPYELTSIPDNTATVTLAVDADQSNNDNTNADGTCSTSLTTAPTASRALSFDSTDSTDDYVSIADDTVGNTLDLSTSGTLEAWVYMFGSVDGAGIIHKDDGTSNGAYSLRFGSGAQKSRIQLLVNDGTVVDTLTGDVSLNLRQWYHVAGTWNATTMAIYIDGILDKSLATTPTAVNSTGSLFIGARNNSGTGSFYGIIDEARVWSTERGITAINDIRDYMCQKVESTDPPFSNLECYLRFDEDFGPICGDTSGNGNIGIITNAVRICSEAPIGDDSTHDYDETSDGGFTVTNAKTGGDSFTAAEDSGTWTNADKSGLQVYRVDGTPEPPNGTIGSRLYTSRSYWGVFVTGGIDPTYAATYTYNDGDIGDENALKLMFRHNNCQPWKDIKATLSVAANTLAYGGLSGTEFILGANVDPRNTITFNYGGANNYVDVTDDATHTDLRLTTAGTLEAWIYKTANTASAGIITKESATDGYSLENDAAGTGLLFRLTDSVAGTTKTITTAATTISLNSWYHIAVTWNAAALNLYINGVLENSDTTNTPFTAGNTALTNMTIGSNGTSFPGMIDEVRVWDVARAQTRIRDTMCKKITSAETDFTNLMGNWRFDEETDSTTCPDYSANSNNGAMFNFGTNAGLDIRAARICSEAPIGDDSDYDYFDLGAGVSVQLIHSDGDYMFATENSGTWNTQSSGIQLYLVNEAPVYPPDLWDDPNPPYSYVTPNGLTPPNNWSSIDYYRYWGVFVTDWNNNPTYDLTYHYNGNPMVPLDDTVLGLAKRDDSCDRTWADSGAALDTGADTLSLTGESTEYVLGGEDAPLAITLSSFTAKEQDDCIIIEWETATEIDTIGFQLWRSEAKNGSYSLVKGSMTASKSVTGSKGASYFFSDCDVSLDSKTDYYYKLEEIDFDSEKTNPFFGPIGPVTDTVSASQFDNKTTGSASSSSCFLDALQW